MLAPKDRLSLFGNISFNFPAGINSEVMCASVMFPPLKPRSFVSLVIGLLTPSVIPKNTGFDFF